MVGDNSGNNTEQRSRPRFLPAWLLVLVAFSTAAIYFYHQYREREEHYINSYYFRTLHEATSELNTKLDQLVRVHAYRESEASKLALFPSYARLNNIGAGKNDTADSGNAGNCVLTPGDGDENNSKASASETDCYQLQLDGHKVFVINTGTASKVGSAEISDIMPQPQNGFVLYLLVGTEKKVLSSTGGERALSIVDTADINRQILEQKNQNWINLLSRQDKTSDNASLKLPGYSYHIDMELTSGPARIFIYPFKVDTRLSLANNGEEGKTVHSTLYLVGVLPENMLDISTLRLKS